MDTIKALRIIATLAFVFLLTTPVLAQSHIEGDALINYLGKDSGSQQLKDLESSYRFEMANETHYLSKAGIELFLKDGLLNIINLYKTSSVYGSFKEKLPRGLSFGMSSGQVKGILGKARVAYNSGYCEFRIARLRYQLLVRWRPPKPG